MAKTDRATLWFDALEELGESDTMYFPEVGEDQKINWHELSHSHHDAIGGLKTLLDAKNSTFNYPFKERKGPSFFKKIRSLIAYNPESKLRHTKWTDFDRTRSNEHLKSLHVLTSKQLELLIAKAKNANCSIQAYTLLELDRFISKQYLENEIERWWMLPVNMRTEDTQFSQQNNSSYISVQLTDSMSGSDIQNMLVKKLKTYTHWAAWFWMRFIQLCGKNSVKKALNYYDENAHGWSGAFTYIEYTSDYQNPIYGLSPVTRAHPIACSMIKANSTLGIGFHVHQALKLDGDYPNNFLDELFASQQ